MIDSAVLRDGDILPAERRLAESLSISRGTVVAAYDALRERDVVERIQGSGTTVRIRGEAIDPAHARPTGDPLFQAPPGSIDLLMAVPTELARLVDHIGRFTMDSSHPLLWTSEPEGIRPLRVAVAAQLSSQGLSTDPDQVLITSGAQQGVSLVVSSLVKPGDVVLTESTTWPGISDTARRLGARVIGVPMDGGGVIVDELESAIQRFRPALIGLNPHHHNPTGTRLAPSRRQLVSNLAAQYQVPLVEDRVMSALAFDGQVPPPLAVHNPEAVSIVVDSVSKTGWPGLRIGWVRADRQSISDLRSSRALADLFSPMPSQLMALDLLTDLEGIVTDRVEQLRRRAATLTALLDEHLPAWEPQPIHGGMVCWVKLPNGSATGFARSAARHGVAIATESEFTTSVGTDRFIRIPFCSEEHVLGEALNRLGQAWHEYSNATDSAQETQPATII